MHFHVRLTRVRVTIVAVERQYVLHILNVRLYSCLSYPTCKTHAPWHTLIFGPSGSIIFFLIISNRHDFQGGGEILNIKCVLWFSLQILSEIFFILRIQRDNIVNVSRFSRKSTHCSCQILMKFEFSRQCFAKSSDNKFHENPSSGSRVFFF